MFPLNDKERKAKSRITEKTRITKKRAIENQQSENERLRNNERKKKSRSDIEDRKLIVALSKVETDKFQTDKEKRAIILDFDKRCDDVKIYLCSWCKCTYVSIKPLKQKAGESVCQTCISNKNRDDTIKNKLLPIWIDTDDMIHYELPNELLVLTQAEKMLIQ
jgi:hypothetical protein